MSDDQLKCNNLKCRTSLTSNIFCLPCSNTHFTRALVCIACDSTVDDIIQVDLNPTEEFKSSVLAGLKPDIIMDIASRALSFHSYQPSQEMYFQSMLYKSLDEMYSNLERTFNSAVMEKESEIKALKDKLRVISGEMERDRKKLEDMKDALCEKSRQLKKMQSVYDKMKRDSFHLEQQHSSDSTRREDMRHEGMRHEDMRHSFDAAHRQTRHPFKQTPTVQTFTPRNLQLSTPKFTSFLKFGKI